MQRQNQPNQSWSDLTIFQKVEVMQGLASYPAMTAMIFLRRNMGHRFLSPVGLFVTTFAMFVVAEYARDTAYYDALQVFAALVLLCGLAERSLRLKEFKKGIFQHSQYIGDSRLGWHRLPEFIRRERRVERFIDPLIWIGFGVGAYHFSPALGGWMVFSGLCLRVFEAAVYQKRQERDVDLADGLIEAQIQQDTVERMIQPATVPAPTFDQAEGIPTGFGPDIEQRVKDRMERREMRQRTAAAREAKAAPSISPPPENSTPPPLTRADKFWRFMWGPKLWNWWQRRKTGKSKQH